MLYNVLNALSNKSVFSLDLKTNNEEATLGQVIPKSGANYRKGTVPPRP